MPEAPQPLPQKTRNGCQSRWEFLFLLAHGAVRLCSIQSVDANRTAKLSGIAGMCSQCPIYGWRGGPSKTFILFFLVSRRNWEKRKNRNKIIKSKHLSFLFDATCSAVNISFCLHSWRSFCLYKSDKSATNKIKENVNILINTNLFFQTFFFSLRLVSGCGLVFI